MSTGEETPLARVLLTGGLAAPTLAEALAKAGVTSGAFVEPGWPDSSDLARGFARSETWNAVELHTLPATLRLAPRAAIWLRELEPDAPFFLFLSCREPSARPADVDRELTRLFRDLDAGGRLERTMIVAAAAGSGATRAASEEDAPLVIFGPLPFRGAGARPEPARAIDVFPTILEAFRHGPDYRLPGRALLRIDPAARRVSGRERHAGSR
jgi:hypothetical protein